MINAIYPAIGSSSSALVRAAERTSNRIGTQVNVVYGTAELDADGAWQDTDGDGNFDIFIWAKNVGTTRILGVANMDVFLGTEGNFQRIPHEDDAGAAFPRWSYTIENGTEWSDAATIKISVDYSATQSSDTYFVKIVTPTGTTATHYFSF